MQRRLKALYRIVYVCGFRLIRGHLVVIFGLSGLQAGSSVAIDRHRYVYRTSSANL